MFFTKQSELAEKPHKTGVGDFWKRVDIGKKWYLCNTHATKMEGENLVYMRSTALISSVTDLCV